MANWSRIITAENVTILGKDAGGSVPTILTTLSSQSSGLTLTVNSTTTNVGNSDGSGGYGYIHLQNDNEGDLILKPGDGPVGQNTPGNIHIGREYGEIVMHAAQIVDKLGNVILTDGSGGLHFFGGGSSDGVSPMATSKVGSGVNGIKITNAVTTASPVLESVGSDTNIDLNIKSKGTGDIISVADKHYIKGDSGDYFINIDPDNNQFWLTDNQSDVAYNIFADNNDGVIYSVGKDTYPTIRLYDKDDAGKEFKHYILAGKSWFSSHTGFDFKLGTTGNFEIDMSDGGLFRLYSGNTANKFEINTDADGVTAISTNDGNATDSDHESHLTINTDGNLTVNVDEDCEFIIQEDGGTYTPTADNHAATKKYVDDSIPTVPTLQDDDNFSTPSDEKVASSESIKAYVDSRKEHVVLSQIVYIDAGTAGRTYFRDADDLYGDRVNEFDAYDSDDSTTVGATISVNWASNTGGIIVPFDCTLTQVQWHLYSNHNYDNTMSFQIWTGGWDDADFANDNHDLTLRATEEIINYKRQSAKILKLGNLATLSRGDVIHPAVYIDSYTTALKWVGRVQVVLEAS